MKKHRLYLLCGLMVTLVLGCKKDGSAPKPDEQEPRTAAEFLNLSYDDQLKYSKEYLKQFLGKKYRYSGRQASEIDERGFPTGNFSNDHPQEAPDLCQRSFEIQLPNGMGYVDYVTVSINENFISDIECDIRPFPYKKTFNLKENTDTNGLPISVSFPDIKMWVEELVDESTFQILPFPYLDTFNTSIVLLKRDGQDWYIYTFSEITE